MSRDAPPSPFHLLRHHSHPLHCLAFSTDNSLLYSGDEQGWVAVTDLRRRRVVAHWKAHEGGVLKVGEWQGGLVSHGRDNQILFHAPFNRHAESLPLDAGTSSASPRSAKQEQPSINSIKTSLTPLLPPPIVKHALPVNALNFCGFAVVQLPKEEQQTVIGVDASESTASVSKDGGSADQGSSAGGAEGLLAVPNLTDSETVDIYHLPSMQRLHAAVTGRPKDKSTVLPSDIGVDGQTRNGKKETTTRSGLVMSIHLYFAARPHAPAAAPASDTDGNAATVETTPVSSDISGAGVTAKNGSSSSSSSTLLNMIVAFEDGRVERWECGDAAIDDTAACTWSNRTDARMNIGTGVWRCRWSEKVHHEAVMDMVAWTGAKSDGRDRSSAMWAAFSVSADHQLVRYSLEDRAADSSRVKTQNTKQIGNSCVTVIGDGRVVAVGGWDGRVRLFSAKSLKSLGTLEYHRDQCRCIAFPDPSADSDASTSSERGDDDDEDDGEHSVFDVARWMASGGKDGRLALWKLKAF